MKTFKIKWRQEVQGFRVVSASVLADNYDDAVSKFRDKVFDRYLVVEQNLVETPVENSLSVTEDTGHLDVV